jgi:septal ring factor EnvC (AmiA/AmiB activator)
MLTLNNFKKFNFEKELSKFMMLIIQIIQQRILHYDELKKLKMINDVNFMTAFENFATQFIILNNVKERQILNLLQAINENSNDLIIVNDNDAKTRHKTKKNENELKNDDYEHIDSSENEEKSMQKVEMKNKIIVLSD